MQTFDITEPKYFSVFCDMTCSHKAEHWYDKTRCNTSEEAISKHGDKLLQYLSCKVFDKIGQEIVPGCVIAYGHLLSRSAGLRIGKVCNVKFNPDDSSTPYRITVHGIDDGYWCRDVKLCKKKGTLLFPDRTIVLKENNLPNNIVELLDTIKI